MQNWEASRGLAMPPLSLQMARRKNLRQAARDVGRPLLVSPLGQPKGRDAGARCPLLQIFR